MYPLAVDRVCQLSGVLLMIQQLFLGDNMKLTYKHTRLACYMAYVCGALINNFTPLLFIVFERRFALGLGRLSMLITFNFVTQLIVDFLGARYVDRIGYRRAMIIALLFGAAGLFLMGVLPFWITPFLGLLAADILYAVGSGLLEVMVSPMIEALPLGKKEGEMALLHSFYCWGCVFVILVSTLFFRLAGLDRWRMLCFIWAMLPAVTAVMFGFVPIVSLTEKREKASFKDILSNGLFWIFALLMLCSGAAEIAVAQWASLFAETGLGVSKAMGDILGPCMFAVFMGCGRILYGKYSEKLELYSALMVSAVICIFGYLVTVFAKAPVISLLGCGITGFGVALMWPGTLSLAAKVCSFGGTALFGLLAMAGDMGCTAGPSLVAAVSKRASVNGSELKAGLLSAIVFSLIMFFGVMMLKITKDKKKDKSGILRN